MTYPFTQTSNVLLTALRAYYQLENNILDSSVNASDATAPGGSITYATGEIGQGATQTSASTKIHLPGSGVALGTTWSVQAWIKPTTAGLGNDWGFVMG